LRILLDTNVLLSAFTKEGLCREVLRLCVDRHDLLISDSIHEEVKRNLHDKFKKAKTEALAISNFLSRVALLVPYLPRPFPQCDDQTDHHVLAAAIDGKADYIVTGDKGLLKLGSVEGIPVITPTAFFEI
jgi:putative PIN family toxin of toxin-antitoxin system